MLFINANIHTMEGTPIGGGWLQTKGGVIAGMGPMADVPSGEKTYDCCGADMYPGFMDAHTHLGMMEDGLTFEGDDLNEDTDPTTPQLRAIDGLNPLDRDFQEAAAAGVTTVVTGPGSANPIGGQMAAIKTCCPDGCIDDSILKAPVAIKMALGENPKDVYHDKDTGPVTRMATAAFIREELLKAQRYEKELHRSEEDEDAEPPEFDMKAEALLPALRGETEVHFHAHRADDIFTAIRIGKEFHLDYVIIHGTEGHLIAPRLAKEHVRVLSGPFLADRSKPELRSQTPACPGILAKAGVQVAIITDHSVIPIQYLPLCAGLAVREGMEREAALRAITIEPARICRLDNRVGSLRQGKDADFSLFDCDPLSSYSKPLLVVENGSIVYERG
ncbi:MULTISPECIES: amidohydrolase [Caproicibacterium]|jgi:imidazolonepropionase-like amidohydrolase|uniref:Amidohydrolase family protein n=1 Tax=Caproicibacterium lactatifermentans TaxID=2666138 RepID=A0A859DRZ8_9FIRM|nr:amidohydrolase [Caproicibacterium lactatifermentans]QKN23562.1 amidohydrolase family protein [Caproicibacterium lactatifermentans]QKO29762.1 amidohydrolase family protein [Caproicibacterium lactatifermentans]